MVKPLPTILKKLTNGEFFFHIYEILYPLPSPLVILRSPHQTAVYTRCSAVCPRPAQMAMQDTGPPVSVSCVERENNRERSRQFLCRAPAPAPDLDLPDVHRSAPPHSILAGRRHLVVTMVSRSIPLASFSRSHSSLTPRAPSNGESDALVDGDPPTARRA
jgi:hypothetical protein